MIQVMVQGAWGVVPTYLNELAPHDVRATLPGFAYQLGNLLAAVTATAQSWLAAQLRRQLRAGDGVLDGGGGAAAGVPGLAGAGGAGGVLRAADSS